MGMRFLLSYFLFWSCFVGVAGNPVKEYVDHPGDFNFEYEAQLITTEDGYTLKSWICKPTKGIENSAVLILAYGDSGNMSFWLRQVTEMVDKGFTVVLFDYRGYGESQEFKAAPKQLYYDEFTLDLKAVIAQTKKQFSDKKIGVWALSMGTIMATMAYTEASYDFLVAEGFVISPQAVVEKIYKFNNEAYSLPSQAKLYESALSRLGIPALLFAGERDGLTTIEDSYRVQLLHPQSETVLFKGGHLQGFQALSGQTHGEKYVKAVMDFVDAI